MFTHGRAKRVVTTPYSRAPAWGRKYVAWYQGGRRICPVCWGVVGTELPAWLMRVVTDKPLAGPSESESEKRQRSEQQFQQAVLQYEIKQQ